MKKFKTIGLSLLVAACAACLSLAFVACKGGEESASYGAGEEGFYYYDGADSARYMLSLQSGKYMITANNETSYSGSYSYDEETGVVSFAGDASFSATMGDSALSLDMTDVGYSFKAYRYFDVTYVDESGNVIATESVLNGQSAPEISGEKDGYYFIGWYEDGENSGEFDFATSIAGDTTVYGWYIKINDSAEDFAVTLDYGDGYTETSVTMNGAVWTLPASYEGRDILGWWVSATNKSGELTYKYEAGTALTSDTTFFAVYSGIGASVTDTGITWVSAGANVSVTVYDEDGAVAIPESSTSSSNISYAPAGFSSLPAGTYTVEVTSGNTAEYLTYIVNGLERVSMSSAEIVVNGDGRVLVFAPVENATGYEITVTDGTRTVTENLGSRTYYNFSAWDMTENGITFTVTAYADGYVSSVSDGYNYLLALDKVVIDIDGENVVWSRVEDALEYEVIIFDESDSVLDSFRTTDTSYSLKYYDAGTYTISVQPVTSGYWSEATKYSRYAKSTLASPVITSVTGFSVSWGAVAGAVSYIVVVNGKETEVAESTTLYITDDTADRYEIAVKAVEINGNDSSYSDSVFATNGAFSSAVSYNRNTVSWNYDISATSYEISVNGGANTYTVSGTNSREIELTKAGDNEIIVTAYDGNTAIGQAILTVYAYSVTLDGNGAKTSKSVVYVAQGDTLDLGTVSLDHADFLGWYTQADFTEGMSDEYEGKGVEVLDGSTFTGNRNTYLYAYYSYEWVTVRLVSNMGSITDENGDEVEAMTVKIKYNSTSFELPTPTPYEGENNFVGWNTNLYGTGRLYTGQDGLSNGTAFQGETTLYAYYRAVLYYTRTSYNGETVYSVSAGSTIGTETSITIPDNYNGYGLILYSAAFDNCTNLVTVNIPDTVLYISTSNDGYSSGTGAFSRCSALTAVNVYSTGKAEEPVYFSDNGVLFHKISNSEGVELIYYPYAKPDTTYTVPSTVSNQKETDYDEQQITHDVLRICGRVLRYCKATTVTIASSVTVIASQTFYNNTYLQEVTFAEGSTAKLTIEDSAFVNCTSLTKVTLPSRYDDFNAAAFTGCNSLMYVDVTAGGAYTSENGILLGDGGNTLVYVPIGYSGDIVISALLSTSSISKIGSNAFGSNVKITSVVISEGITEIGESAFEGCIGLKSVEFKGEANSAGLTIKTRAFYGCLLLTEIILPVNLVAMEADAFGGCSNISYVYFDSTSGATSTSLNFATGSFGTSNNITTLELGTNVPDIDFAGIFDGGMLSMIIIAEDNNYYSSDEFGAVYTTDKTVIKYFPLGGAGAYTLAEGVTEIPANIFAKRVNLTSITIGKNVNTIAQDAFAGCTSLVSINVDSQNANYCSDQYGILYAKDTNGNAVEIVYCPIKCNVETLEIGSTVVKASKNAFYNNATLKTVSFATTEEFEMGEAMFYQAPLVSVTLPNKLKDGLIPYQAFYYCTSLETVENMSGVTEIGAQAFCYCPKLKGDLNREDDTTGIELPEGLLKVGATAFWCCYDLAVTIPSTVTDIGERGFYACWDQASATAEIVFASADADDEGVHAENTVETPLTLGANVFASTSYATKVVIPARITALTEGAFNYIGSKITYPAVEFEEGCNFTSLPKNVFASSAIQTFTVPASVTSIGETAFSSCTSLTKIDFEEGSELESIEKQAFYGCLLLEEVGTIPASVKSIGESAFSAATTPNVPIFTKIEFAGGSQLETIDTGAFRYVKTLESITIPASVTFIGKEAFYRCNGLATLEFEDGIQLNCLGDECFYQCYALTEVVLPEGLTRIDTTGTSSYGVFEECTALETVTLPASLQSLSIRTFYNCSSLTTINFAEGSALSSIENRAFYGCTSLESFEFPTSTASSITLGTRIFDGCEALTSVNLSAQIADIGGAFAGSYITEITVADNHPTYIVGEDHQILYSIDMGTIAYVCEKITAETIEIPDTITAIGASAFNRQTGIKKVIIPSSVVSIGDFAFYRCSNLEEVYFESAASGSSSDAGLTSVGQYAFYNCNSLTSINLPDTVTTIGTYCFYSYADLSQCSFDSVKSIGSYAFAYTEMGDLELPSIETISDHAFYYSTLKSVTLGEKLQTIETYAFDYCSSLVEVNFSEGITSTGTYIFYGCTALTSIVLPESMTTIGNYIFYNCSGLVSCYLPSGLKTMPAGIFYNCTSLESIVFPDAVTTTGASCFYGCTGLKSVTINDNLTKFDSQVFYNCKSLETIIVGKSVTEFGQKFCQNCTSLTYAYTGDLVTALPNYAFDGCESLETVEFGPAVTSIGQYSFRNCTSIETITLEKGLTTISSSVFYSCTSLKSIMIPSTVSSVGSNAFYSCTCDIFVENTKNYADNWSSWKSSFAGTVYYLSQSEPGFNDEGTDYDGDYWYYGDDAEIAIWVFSYTTYIVEAGGYVLCTEDDETSEISYVCVFDEEAETSEVFAVTECTSDATGYTVTLENGESYTVVLDEDTQSATITATAAD